MPLTSEGFSVVFYWPFLFIAEELRIWKKKGKSGSFVGVRRYFHAAVMGLDHLFDNGQSQSGPGFFVGDKGIEKSGQVLRLNAAAIICNLNTQIIPLVSRNNMYRPVFRDGFTGVSY